MKSIFRRFRQRKNTGPETAARKLRRLQGQRGSMVEYLIILVLIAVVSVSIVSKFGIQINNMWNNSASTMQNVVNEGQVEQVGDVAH